MSDSPEETRLLPALRRLATILEGQTAELASIGRHLESIDLRLARIEDRLEKAESRVAGLELHAEEDLPGNGHA